MAKLTAGQKPPRFAQELPPAFAMVDLCGRNGETDLASQVRPQVFHSHPLILCQPLPHCHGDAPDGFAAVSTCRNALDALAGPLGGKAGRRKGKPKGGLPHFVTFLSANTTSAAVRCLQISPRPPHE